MYKLTKAIKNPEIILSRCYAMLTGISVRELESQNKMLRGTIDALAKMS
ncbi:MAG: hypothetical protein JWM39_799, partial [Parcubacteria group bacterium]|nr:hypothetical protein [Parcubacteria group bacterium]